MTAEQFVYWLQGFMEVGQPRSLNDGQIQVIKDHLKLVFDKQTPDRTPQGTDPIIPTGSIQGPPFFPQPGIAPNIVPGTTQPYSPYTGPDWTWRPNPYTITCTGVNSNNDLNDPNKKFC